KSTYRSSGEKSEKAHAYRSSAAKERANHTREKSLYLISLPIQARAVMQRRVQILVGNSLATIFNLMSFIIQGVIRTVFLKIPDSTSAYLSRGGVLFSALLFCALSSIAEIPPYSPNAPFSIVRSKSGCIIHSSRASHLPWLTFRTLNGT
ncbi:hypothetical protein EV360DRAFT_77297, partial [Lentinula raphanica]